MKKVTEKNEQAVESAYHADELSLQVHAVRKRWKLLPTIWVSPYLN